MKTFRRIAVWLCLLGLMGSSATGATKLMVVSDIHYLARPLYEDSALFLRALRAGDGKLAQYGDELMTALCGQVTKEAPDALIVTGDLAFNGEKQSHEALAKYFEKIESDGVPVWVLPGNHDINVPTARRFSGDQWEYVDSVTPEEFRAIYADFMGETGGANLCYVADIDDRFRVAMTDVAFYQEMSMAFGVFTAAHAEWLKKALDEAGRDGVQVITASHHSLLKHTDFSADSYQMMGHEAMEAINRQYGVGLNLSGHLHAQHILRQDGLADAALGAFCAWPHRYATVVFDDDGALRYEAHALDDALLPEGFMDMSRHWYLDIATEKTRAFLAEEALADSERDAMAEYAARFNLAWFSGAYDPSDPAWRDDPAFALWQRLPENAFWQYMNQVMNEPAGDNLILLSRLSS